MDNFLIYEEIQKRDACIVYRGRIKRSIDFVMIYCVDKYKRHELSNLVRLMYELDNSYVMKFREWYETTNHLWLVMDLCDGGSLKSIIQSDGPLPESSIRTIGINVCQGLYYLHQQDIIFCDLNPEKIISDGSNTFKLGNMSLSRIKGENLQTIFDETYDNYLDDVYRGKERPKAQAENHFYTAPEILRGGEYSISSDLWSLGCILYEMFAGKQLFDEKNTNKLTQKILNDRFVLPTARGSAKPSIEFASLLQGLLVKEPSKRLDWPAILTHPFWAGQLTHLVRPQTGVSKKSVNHNETQDRAQLSSRIATTDRPESNVSFSLSCTKTSIQISQANKTDDIDGHKPSTANHSSINTHEQSTSMGSEKIEHLRRMLFSKAELRPTSIIENSKIQKTLPFKFETKLLPFQLGKYENLSRLSSVDLQEHVNLIKKELITTPSSPTNTNGMRAKLNLLNYIGWTCLEQANSGTFTDALIAKELHKDLLNLIINGSSMEIKMKSTRLLGIIFNKATENLSIPSSLTDILVSLTEVLRANSKETKFKLYLLQAIGEIIIFIAGRASDNSLVPGFTYQLIARCLKDGDDSALNHAACKIIENLLLVADKQADKLSTTEIALALWNISSTVGNNEHLRASALAALCHMGLSYSDIVQSVIDKVTIKADILQITSSKVLQYNITLLAILAKRTKNRTMFIQEILPKINVLYENTNILIRAKAYTLTFVLLSTYSESIYTLSETKLFQAIERDVRRTSADQDENDLLHEALNRLTTLLTSLFTRTIDELLTSTEQTRKTSPAKDAFKKWLPSFRFISTIMGNNCIRTRVITLMSIKKFFKLFINIKLITELHSELTKGQTSLTEIISYISQTLDAFVRARDLLSLFSELLLTDLLPLCSQLLVSSINVDEFSLLALCILNELMNELKLTDCVLPVHIQHNIKQEFSQTFLPLIIDRHILREEPIVLLSLRFIQTLWLLIDQTTTNLLMIITQSKFISNLFQLIQQNKDKSTGILISNIISTLTILAEKKDIIQIMIEHGFVNIQLQLIQEQLNFTNTDRTIMNILLELLSLLDRDLTYVLDIVKRALQVKKTGAGDSDLPSTAEKLLQVHKPLVALVGPMINLLSIEDLSVSNKALHNLSLLTQLIGSEGKAILTKNHCHILSSTLRTTDTTKQKLLLRALKRLISADKKSIDVVKSTSNNELTQTLQQLKKSAATEADAGLISHVDELLHLLL